MINIDKTPVAVLISGRGSNMQSILDACESPEYPAKVAIVISDNADAKGLEVAKYCGIKTLVIDKKNFADKAAFETELSNALKKHDVEWVCLAGFMRILSSDFVDNWHNKIINIHPSLLPAFKGLDCHQKAIDAGVRFSGCTVHIVRPEMDVGPIIIQAVVPITKNDDAESLSARILHYEHVLYPESIRLLITGEAMINGEKVDIHNGRWQKTGHVNPAPLI